MAHFEETKLRHVHTGDQATITLMGFDIQVRTHIDWVPSSVLLAAGMTCTVTVGPRATGRSSSLQGLLSRLASD